MYAAFKEKFMKKEVGLWIDHRKTVIVTFENEVEMTREIRSNIDKSEEGSTSSRSDDNLSQGSTAEDVRDRKYGDHLGRYYEGVISLIRSADSIWIIGPGEAKVELETRLKDEDLGERIVGVETVDRLSDHQIAARVRQHYHVYPVS
jgi:hypothetical protein